MLAGIGVIGWLADHTDILATVTAASRNLTISFNSFIRASGGGGIRSHRLLVKFLHQNLFLKLNFIV